MNPEWVKSFVELVKSGAPIKAYQKKLGLDKEGLQYHLARLAEYEASLECKKVVVKPKVGEIQKKTSIVKSVLDKVKKRLDDEKVVEDESGETS